MGLTRRVGCGAPASTPLPEDGRPSGPHTDPNPGDIGAARHIASAALVDPLEMGHLAVPAGKAEDRVGLGDGEPAFDVVDGAALDLARLHMPAVELACQLAELGLGEIAHRTR